MLFQDPQLDALEARVGSANQNLKAAFARLQEARAATRIARADLFPTLSLGASAARARTSAYAPRFRTGQEPTLNNFDLEADLSYEVDLWGRVRNSVNAAKANRQASAADLASLDLALHAELATDYYTLRSQDAQQVLLEKTVEDYSRSLHLTTHLYRGGAAAVADVDQAQAQLETARTQAADIALGRAQTEHAIAVLIGENPSGFHLDSNPLPTDTAPPPIDAGLPSTLLQRRPDVAAAERRVAAASAQIGVARAAYFPVFSLAAAAGFDSSNASTWLDAPSRIWSVGPQGVLTVFDAGRHRAQAAQAHALYDEQVADYRGAVLTAYQEVEDNLAALHRLEQESISESAAVTARIPLQGGAGHVSRGCDHGDHRPAGAIVPRQHLEPTHGCQRVIGQSARWWVAHGAAWAGRRRRTFARGPGARAKPAGGIVTAPSLEGESSRGDQGFRTCGQCRSRQKQQQFPVG